MILVQLNLVSLKFIHLMCLELLGLSICSDFWNAHNNSNIIFQSLDEVGNIINAYETTGCIYKCRNK